MGSVNKGTVGWLWEFAAPHRAGYLLSVICAVAGVAMSIGPYFCVARMILLLIEGSAELAAYGSWCLAMAGFWLLRYLLHGISTAASHKATFAVIAEVRLRLTAKLSRLPMGYVLDTPSGNLKNILVEKIDAIETTLAHIVPEMSANLLVSLGVLIYLFVLDWRMALASLVTLPLGLFSYMAMMSGYEARFANYVAKNKHLNATAVEYIGGIEVIKAFNQSAGSYEKFTTAAREAAHSAIDWMQSTLGYFSLAMSVFPATLVSVLPVGCILSMRGTLAPDVFLTCVILSLGLMGPLIAVMSYSDDIGRVTTIVGDIASVLEQPDLDRPAEGPAPGAFDIALRGVSFSYGEELVLHGVDLEIPAGSVTALVGPSGGGKSTIAKLIASLWEPTGGSIELGGADLRGIPLETLNECIAYVSQDNYLFDDSIRENIRMGRPGASDEEVERVARVSGCHEFIMGLENGYETGAGGGGGHLSGGERQRIAIARAMLKDAPVVILDEATAYTDPENEAVIQSAVSRLVRGKTLIVIAHRLSTITDSDQIVVIEDGAVAAQGTHEALLEGSALYRSMWSAHIAVRDSAQQDRDSDKGVTA